MSALIRLEGVALGRVWQRFWLYIFFVCLFLDLGGSLNLRPVAITIFTVTLFCHPKALFAVFCRPLVIVIFLVWPLISVIIGLSSSAEISIVVQNIAALSIYPFFVAYFSAFRLDDSLWAFQTAALTVMAIAIVFWLALLLNNPIALATAEKLSEMEVGFFGPRELGGLIFSVVYFKSTLFYVFAGVLLIAEKRYWTLSFVLFALIAAMSKTGVIVVLVVLFARIFSSRSILMFTLMAAGALVVLAGADYSAILDVFTALSSDTNTVDVRLDHWYSLVSFFEENPLSFIFGQGAGTMFYSSAVGDYVNNIELDHLNSIRKFGVVWFTALSLFVGYVSHALFKDNEKWLSMALVITFLICGTNPVLLTLLFMSILALCYVAVSQSRYLKLSAASNCGIV